MTDLQGKRALVTGASKGIGKAIAAAFAEAGAQVMICSRKPADLEAAATEIGNGVRWCEANAGDPEQAAAAVRTTCEAFGGIDILVNNAATNPYAGPTIDIDLPRWDKTWQVNVTGPLAFTQAAWQASMRDGPGGASVINVSSIGGLRTNAMLGAYDITKAALIHLTKQLAAELGPKVRVNALCPGLVKTEFARVLWEGEGGKRVAQANPARRLGEPEDIALAALFLASDDARFVSGDVMVVDGGQVVAFPSA